MRSDRNLQGARSHALSGDDWDFHSSSLCIATIIMVVGVEMSNGLPEKGGWPSARDGRGGAGEFILVDPQLVVVLVGKTKPPHHHYHHSSKTLKTLNER